MPRPWIGALLACLLPALSFAQANRINWQGILADEAGNPISGPVNLKFHFYDAKTGGTAAWTFDTVGVELEEGMASLSLGPVPSGARFERKVYLGIQVNGGAELPRTPVLPVPAALTLAVPAKVIMQTVEDDGVAALEVENQDRGYGIHGRTGYTTGTAVRGTATAGGTAVSGWSNNLDGSGGPGVGVEGMSDFPEGFGIHGVNRASTGDAVAILGETGSPTGIAIEGHATSTTGRNYGVRGESESETGRGVLGAARSLTGLSYGVMGLTQSSTGRGVFGVSQADFGDSQGVYGRTNTDEGAGVFGEAMATIGHASGVTGRSDANFGFGGHFTGKTGVYGTSSTTFATGVFGDAVRETGDAFGVRGRTNSDIGFGVWGQAMAATGVNYGVQGYSASQEGFGGYFYGGTGVRGSATGSGYGGMFTSVTGDGGLFLGKTAVIGQSASTIGIGVSGEVTATSGENYGVRGHSASSQGYGGYFTGRHGIKGESTTATGWGGVFSGGGTGVYGAASASNGKGGYFSGVYGAYGNGTDPSGTQTTYGVYGDAVGAQGYGGFFLGPVGVKAWSRTAASPDLVLGSNGDAITDAIGIISSDPERAGSSIDLRSNHYVRVYLDVDGSESNSSFIIHDTGGAEAFRVYENGTVRVNGTTVHSSDRNRKEAFEVIDPRAVLESVADMPITRWRYRDQNAPHMGPVAQDFYAAFGLGEDEVSIASVDADGVALAAIQGLYELVQELRDQNQALQARVEELERR